jgi:GMP synthase (glutamine-hydrolysing)
MDILQQVKRLGFDAYRLAFETSLEELQQYGAVIGSGGPDSVYEPGAPKFDERLVADRQDAPPFLGICYTAQLINQVAGGKVESLGTREDGFTDIVVEPSVAIFGGLAPEQNVLMSHGDTVTQLAPGFESIARSGELIAGIADVKAKMYGLQFHPEVGTAAGPTMLRNFLEKVAGLTPSYTYEYEDFITDAVLEVQQLVGEREVLAFVSGGVDSAALAALLKRALSPEQVHLVYVDHGFMREGESEEVRQMMAAAGIDVTVFDASHMFAAATTIIDGVETLPLNMVTDPEIKRKIIGDTFVKVQDHMAEELGLDPDTFMLAMGTLHTDLIESGSQVASAIAATIKSHHNDTQLVRQLRSAGRVLEPWRTLQKDDVREVAKLLGLPEAIAQRQPFPGPGLAIRIICAEQPYQPADFDEVDALLNVFGTDKIHTALLPVRTVGVQGDHRTYGYLAALSGEQDWATLYNLAQKIPRSLHSINRVAYVFGEPMRDKITEITPTFLTPDVTTQVRQADHIVNRILKNYGLDRTLSQVPVVSFPVSFGEPGKRSIGIRSLITTNYKTGNIALPGREMPTDVLREIVSELLQLPGIARVAYDLTTKPPATTEWE